MFREYQDSLSAQRQKFTEKTDFLSLTSEIMRCTGDEESWLTIGQALEYVLEMIMSPFWRELKWRMWWDGCLSVGAVEEF